MKKHEILCRLDWYLRWLQPKKRSFFFFCQFVFSQHWLPCCICFPFIYLWTPASSPKGPTYKEYFFLSIKVLNFRRHFQFVSIIKNTNQIIAPALNVKGQKFNSVLINWSWWSINLENGQYLLHKILGYISKEIWLYYSISTTKRIWDRSRISSIMPKFDNRFFCWFANDCDLFEKNLVISLMIHWGFMLFPKIL